MTLYFNPKKQRLRPLKPVSFRLEKELQQFFEQHLETLTGLDLIASEFTLKNRRFDSLAFDHENKAFVIIEYKRGSNYSVVDQGMAYLNLMLDNKAECLVEYNESGRRPIKRTDVDWSQSRLLFVSPGFNNDQKAAVNFRDFNIELWEVNRFEGDLIEVRPHTSSGTAPSYKEVSSHNKWPSRAQKELKTYTEASHLALGSATSIELYEELKTRILHLDAKTELKVKKQVIGFMASKTFVDVLIQKSGLKIFINLKKGALDDPKNMTRDMSNKGHWGNGDYEVLLKSEMHIDYVMSLIRQSYDAAQLESAKSKATVLMKQLNDYSKLLDSKTP